MVARFKLISVEIAGGSRRSASDVLAPSNSSTISSIEANILSGV